ncbi:S-type pyocin domain-containing protein [Morganella morganii]|uniref:S-type pyocin domain-containing protein n=1 Tax=Morganella morganii TaxID=582 RepID=UPI000907F73A|nr:S-type pyocin domain-containing protein [Morganella morganii]
MGTDNQFVELASSTHPDDFGGRGWHTGGDIEPVDVPTNTGNHNPYIPERPDSSGGFQAHDDNGPVILTTPAPGEQDFNDYILITPIPDIPAIYVYLSEKGKRTKNRLPEGKNGDNGPANDVLEKRHPETNELQQLRRYDSEGKPIKDIDFGHDHGAGDPHAHDWVYPSEQAPNKIRLDGRPLKTGETIND